MEEVYEIRYHYWHKTRYIKMQWLISVINASQQKGRFRYLNLDNQKVCANAFQELLGMNKNTYSRAKKLSNNKKKITVSCKNPRNPDDSLLHAISWLVKYGNFYGDRMPNSNDILLPYRTIKRHVFKKIFSGNEGNQQKSCQ